MKNRIFAASLGAVALLLLAACDFDFPLTAKATRPVDPRLVGNWAYTEHDGKRIERMIVRQLDEFNYVVAYEGELYRAQHSDWSGLPLISVQDLNPAPGRYVYLHWVLSADGTELKLKAVREQAIPKTAKDQAAVADFIKANASDPKLYGNEAVFHLQPKPQFGR